MYIYVLVCIHVCVFVYKQYLRTVNLDSTYLCGVLPILFFQLTGHVKADEVKPPVSTLT